MIQNKQTTISPVFLLYIFELGWKTCFYIRQWFFSLNIIFIFIWNLKMTFNVLRQSLISKFLKCHPLLQQSYVPDHWVIFFQKVYPQQTVSWTPSPMFTWTFLIIKPNCCSEKGQRRLWTLRYMITSKIKSRPPVKWQDLWRETEI